MIRWRVRQSHSRIHGLGVFTAENIPARSKIGEVTGRIISRREARSLARKEDRIYLVDVSDTHTLDCTHGNLLRLLNHSCRPNAYLRIINSRVEVYAKREIVAGEEITVDYGETPHSGGMRCRCGHPKCRGLI